MKKLLVVSTSFPKQPGDGLSPFIWEFCRALSELGWQVTALVPHHRGLPDRETWGDVTIRRFRYLPERFEDMGYSGGIMPNIKRKPWKALKLPMYIYAMYRDALKIAVDEDIDLVNFHWLFPASFWLPQFVRSSGLPVVLTGHGTDIHLAARSIFKLLANRAMKKAAGLTVNSNYSKGLLKKNALPPRVEVIPMGVDIEKFQAVRGRPSDSKTILYVGRLIKQKGVELLVNSFVNVAQQIPDARLEIIGYGPERDYIAKVLHAHDLGDRASIIDMVPHDELPAIYGRARVLVLPALVGEGLGMTPAEAGAVGVPTVTFALGGTSELVIDGETAMVVQPNQEALTDGLLHILRSDVTADQLGRQARAYIADTISWQAISQKFDAFFSEIIAGYSGSQKPLSGKAAIFTVTVCALVAVLYLVKLLID